RVVNDQTGCVNAKGTFTIVVNPKPTITLPANPLTTCDKDVTNNGLFLYPLDVLEANILGASQSNTAFTVTFYNDENDARLSQNAISDKVNYFGYTHKLWIRVENNITHCFELDKSPQIVELIPEPIITTVNNINNTCFDYITDYPDRSLILTADNIIPAQGATPNTYQWFEGYSPTTLIAINGAINKTYEVNQAAMPKGATRYYAVEEKSASLLACPVTSPVFEVIQSGKAVNETGTIGYFVTNAFEDNQIVTITTTGYGTYQYQLDNGVFQDSPVFEHVSLIGPHIITVLDTEGGVNFSCDDYQILNVQTIDYPHYFTPNGDGINDKWNIYGLSQANDVKIYIFDRDGKLLKQVSPKGEGWDGNFDGNPYPASDYWFTIDYTEQGTSKQYKSHFSLKR
ncbi:MAG: T9SS type B sorting domain-containing protein, partial [Flavobacterium sp.]|nr:T9SS type B sorting domain-containing protein [Flavobacterium sp.]